jgi:hypothetical protein
MERYALEEPVSRRQCSHLEQAVLKTTLDQVSDIPTVSKQLEPDNSLQRKRRRDSIEAAEAAKAWNEERSFQMVEQRLAPSVNQIIQQKIQRAEQGLGQRVEEMIEQKLEHKIVEQFERRLESMIEAVFKKWQPKEESTSAQRSTVVHDGIDGNIEPRNHTAKKFFDSGFGSCFSRTSQSRYSHVLSCISGS